MAFQDHVGMGWRQRSRVPCRPGCLADGDVLVLRRPVGRAPVVPLGSPVVLRLAGGCPAVPGLACGSAVVLRLGRFPSLVVLGLSGCCGPGVGWFPGGPRFACRSATLLRFLLVPLWPSPACGSAVVLGRTTGWRGNAPGSSMACRPARAAARTARHMTDPRGSRVCGRTRPTGPPGGRPTGRVPAEPVPAGATSPANGHGWQA